MSATTPLTAHPALVPLDWECAHFGYRVVRLDGPDLADAALADTLELARRQGVRLVVWPAHGSRNVSQEVLDSFGGLLADRKATFCRSLSRALLDGRPQPLGSSIVPYTGGAVSAALYELAISAGAYSRFKLDRHFPSEKFAAMYRVWIERSVRGEMADAVLVATRENKGAIDKPLDGMVTVCASADAGQIGLIAVSASARGQGIGSSLIVAAHRWMAERGAQQAKVVTQLANLPACRLYERSGYRLSALEHVYHFWLQAR